MDLESHRCIVNRKTLFFSSAQGFMDAMLRTSYIRLTTIFQKQFYLTITQIGH